MKRPPVRCLYALYQPCKPTRPRILSVCVNAKHPWPVYQKYGYTLGVTDRLIDLITVPQRDFPSTDERLYRAKRIICFVDITSIFPVNGAMSPLHRHIPLPNGADHITCLVDAQGTPFVLMEPYGPIARYQAELARLDVAWSVIPQALAPYNGGDRNNPSTVSILLTQPIYAAALKKIERRITNANGQCLSNAATHRDISWVEAGDMACAAGEKA